MIERVAFEVRTEAATPDHYRHDWVPAPGVTLGGIWGPAVVTAGDGRWYFGLRGWSDFVYGMTHTVSPVCGFRALQPGLGADPPHLYPEYARTLAGSPPGSTCPSAGNRSGSRST